MNLLSELDKWHKSTSGYIVFTLVELGLAYAFASLSINSGNLWWYLITIIFFIGALKNLFKFLNSIIHVKH